MADEALDAESTRVKTITDNLEASYRDMQAAASDITSLISAGKATCNEVRTYNLYALSIYSTQQGMLATLKAAGQENVPDLPPQPTLFTWRDRPGEEAQLIDCNQEPQVQANDLQGVMGLMAHVLKGPTTDDVFLSSDQVRVNTQGTINIQRNSIPTIAQVTDERWRRDNQLQGQLGFVPVWLWVAGVALFCAAVAVSAIMKYLSTSKVEEERSERMREQAKAFKEMTTARLSCFQSCVATGATSDACTKKCTQLVPEPKFQDFGAKKPWGVLEWTGLATIATALAWVGWRYYQRRYGGSGVSHSHATVTVDEHAAT